MLCVFAIPESAVRRDYRLTGDGGAELDRHLRRFFDFVEAAKPMPGDILLCSPRERRWHLAIECGDSFVHADARLRSVVEVPGPPPWPVVASYRARNSNLRSD